MFSDGAANVTVQLPSVFSDATGPAFGSQPQKGPVNLTEVAEASTPVNVIVKSCE